MVPSSTSGRATVAWAIAGAGIVAVVAYVAATFVGAIVVGIFLYYATRPIYRRLAPHVDHPDVTATVTILVVGLPLLLVLGYAALVGVRELDQFLTTVDLEQYRSVLDPYRDLASLTDPAETAGRIRDLLPPVLAVVNVVFLWLIRLFLVFVVSFYLLRDDQKIGRWFRRSFRDDSSTVAFFEGVDEDVGRIYVGNLVTIGISTAIAVATYFALDLVAPAGSGIGFPFLLGLLTGVGTLIPAVGMKIVYGPYGLYLLWQAVSGGEPIWFPIVFFAVTVVVVDSFPDLFVRSYVSSGEMNVGLVLLAYVLTPAAFGWYGVFLAPILIVLFVHFAERVFPNLVRGSTDGLVSD